jgi:hypothetical protein
MMTNEETERLERWLDRFRQKGVVFAEALARYELAEAMTKTIKASLMKDAEANGIASIAAQERDALAAPDFQAHLGGLYKARMELEVARTELEAMRMLFSGRQTINANTRAEVRAYGSP